MQPSLQVRGLTEQRATPAPLAELLPGATTERRQTVGGVRALGAVEATVRLEALASPGTQPPGLAPVTATVTDWTVPWWLAAAVVAVVLLALVALRRRGSSSRAATRAVEDRRASGRN